LYLVRNDPVAAMAGVIEGLSGMKKLLDDPFGSCGRLVVDYHSHLSGSLRIQHFSFLTAALT
jgi:hypothetical protein